MLRLPRLWCLKRTNGSINEGFVCEVTVIAAMLSMKKVKSIFWSHFDQNYELIHLSLWGRYPIMKECQEIHSKDTKLVKHDSKKSIPTDDIIHSKVCAHMWSCSFIVLTMSSRIPISEYEENSKNIYDEINGCDINFYDGTFVNNCAFIC